MSQISVSVPSGNSELAVLAAEFLIKAGQVIPSTCISKMTLQVDTGELVEQLKAAEQIHSPETSGIDDWAELEAAGQLEPEPSVPIPAQTPPPPVVINDYENESIRLVAGSSGPTLAAYYGSGWNDETLVSHGHAEKKPPAVAPSPAAVAPAPTAPTAPPPSSSTALPTANANGSATPQAPINQGNAVDKDGIPWDVRIHSEGKTFIADGTWRKKKGVSPAVYDQVVAELRGVPGAAPAPVPTPAQTAAPVPPAATGTVGAGKALMAEITAALRGGKLTPDTVKSTLATFGIDSPVKVAASEDAALLAQIRAAFPALGA